MYCKCAALGIHRPTGPIQRLLVRFQSSTDVVVSQLLHPLLPILLIINRHAELAFALICSCLVVLPRLYQHLTSVAPYTGPKTTTARALEDQSMRPASRNRRRDWVQLETQGMPSLPPAVNGVGRKGSDDEAFDEAVEGKVGGG